MAKILTSENNDKFTGQWINFKTFNVVCHPRIPYHTKVFKAVRYTSEIFGTLHMPSDLFNLFAYLFIFNPLNMLTDLLIHNLTIILTLMKIKDLWK